MRSKTQKLLLSILAITASSLASADASTVSVNVKTETVRYDDLRLISTVGAAVLYGRLKGAAERVCGGPMDSAQIAEQKRYRACVDDALMKAVAEVNHPILTQFYELKRSKSAPLDTGVTNDSAVAKAR
jgi:UrcA family protein